jgi:hypothetical protein
MTVDPSACSARATHRLEELRCQELIRRGNTVSTLETDEAVVHGATRYILTSSSPQRWITLEKELRSLLRSFNTNRGLPLATPLVRVSSL